MTISRTPPRRRPTIVTTLLHPMERMRVDAAGTGFYDTLHRNSLDDAVRDLREGRAGALLVSVTRCAPNDAARMAAVVREFPRAPSVALLSTNEPESAQTVLAMGRSGMTALVDVRSSTGWSQLRAALQIEALGDIERLALSRLTVDLARVSEDCWFLFESMLQESRSVGTVGTLCRRLGVVPSTLMSRFFRARIPAPKRYMAYMRLMRAGRLFENPGLSIAAASNYLEFSSPQSFGRHVRVFLDMSAGEFRARYDGEGMLERLRSELIIPYREKLEALRPLSPGA